MQSIKALTFDTGGTLLDWHSGFRDAFGAAGARHGVTRDWPQLANELRHRALGAMINLGENGPPAYNFDQAHRFTLDTLLTEHDLDMFDEADRHAIAWDAPHAFKCWPDCAEGLSAIRQRYIVASFTILSYRLIIDTARANGLTWDAVLSCEGFGVYKILPEAYAKAAKALQLEPHECLMVACHAHDLDAARAVGFRTALVRRPEEWGPEAYRPEPVRSALETTYDYDITVDDFIELSKALQ
ncbi:HAD-IA family hydrolase [Rhodobacteraceae bacterium D3-12]|nr:HAD-IA family hydrolase [Rhodobacteraceae bacterium D3-12]